MCEYGHSIREEMFHAMKIELDDAGFDRKEQEICIGDQNKQHRQLHL